MLCVYSCLRDVRDVSYSPNFKNISKTEKFVIHTFISLFYLFATPLLFVLWSGQFMGFHLLF